MEQQWQYVNRETFQNYSIKPIQTVVEADSALSGGLRDECKIYYCGANAYIRSAEVLGGKINAEGRIHFRVLYAQGDMKKILPMEVDADFSQYIMMPTDNDEYTQTSISVKCSVLQTRAHVQNGRIQLRAILQLNGYVRAMQNISCVSILPEANHIQCLTETIDSQRICGEGEVQSMLKDEVDLSDLLQVQDTLLADAHAVVEDIRTTSANSVCVTGSVMIDAYHTSAMPQRPLIVSHHKIPYEQEISFSGKSSSIISAQTSVRDIAVVSTDSKDEMSEKHMRCEVLLHTHVKAVEEERYAVLKDAYPVSEQIFTSSSQQVNYTQEFIEEEIAESGRLTVNLSANAPRIRQALLTFLNPILVRKRKTGSKLLTDGTMQIFVIYLTDSDDIPVTAEVELPFSAAFSSKAVPDDHISLSVSEASVQSITSERMEIKYLLHMHAEGEHNYSAATLTSIEAAANSSLEQKHNGIILRYVQQNETLWDIGKQFRIPTEIIQNENNLKENQVLCGEALVICGISQSQHHT